VKKNECHSNECAAITAKKGCEAAINTRHWAISQLQPRSLNLETCKAQLTERHFHPPPIHVQKNTPQIHELEEKGRFRSPSDRSKSYQALVLLLSPLAQPGWLQARLWVLIRTGNPRQSSHMHSINRYQPPSTHNAPGTQMGMTAVTAPSRSWLDKWAAKHPTYPSDNARKWKKANATATSARQSQRKNGARLQSTPNTELLVSCNREVSTWRHAKHN